MSHENKLWTPDLIAARDGHLQAVVSALSDAGVPTDELDNIREDLEQQIIAMCSERCEEDALSLDILDDVLDALDSPEVLAGGNMGDENSSNDISTHDERAQSSGRAKLARYAFAISIIGIIAGPLVDSLSNNNLGNPSDAGWNLYFFSQLTALICAVWSVNQYFARVTLCMIAVQAVFFLLIL